MSELRLPRINKWIGSGRITNDIELRYTAKGTPVVNFTLAVDKSSKDEQGNWKNEASFIKCVAWNKQAEILNEKAHKGSPVIVEGRLESKEYTDKENVNHKSVEIVADYVQYLEIIQECSLSAEEDVMPLPTNDDVPF